MKADPAQVNRLLKTARGQIDGILKMVEEDRYCLDVSSQIMAAQSILKGQPDGPAGPHGLLRPGGGILRRPRPQAGGAGRPFRQAGRMKKPPDWEPLRKEVAPKLFVKSAECD